MHSPLAHTRSYPAHMHSRLAPVPSSHACKELAGNCIRRAATQRFSGPREEERRREAFIQSGTSPSAVNFRTACLRLSFAVPLDSDNRGVHASKLAKASKDCTAVASGLFCATMEGLIRSSRASVAQAGPFAYR